MYRSHTLGTLLPRPPHECIVPHIYLRTSSLTLQVRELRPRWCDIPRVPQSVSAGGQTPVRSGVQGSAPSISTRVVLVQEVRREIVHCPALGSRSWGTGPRCREFGHAEASAPALLWRFVHAVALEERCGRGSGTRAVSPCFRLLPFPINKACVRDWT